MKIKNTITKVISRQKLTLAKNSPHILFVAGVGGIVTSTVLACRATLKLNEKLDDFKHSVDDVKDLVPHEGSTYSAMDHRKDTAYVYGRGTFELVRLYAPAVAVGGLSILALTGSHVQLTRRNTALTAAYTGLHQAYNEYRSRVRAEVGEDKERDIYFGATTEMVENDKGKLVPLKSIDPNGMSIYARCFDEQSANYTRDPELNLVFLRAQQNYANDILQVRGHLFLNDVYDMLGLERSSPGSVVGWVISKEGDNYVDFGLYDCNSARFTNGNERSVWLDFNVDGVIYDKI